jgi:hypothetical protein
MLSQESIQQQTQEKSITTIEETLPNLDLTFINPENRKEHFKHIQKLLATIDNLRIVCIGSIRNAVLDDNQESHEKFHTLYAEVAKCQSKISLYYEGLKAVEKEYLELTCDLERAKTSELFSLYWVVNLPGLVNIEDEIKLYQEGLEILQREPNGDPKEGLIETLFPKFISWFRAKKVNSAEVL